LNFIKLFFLLTLCSFVSFGQSPLSQKIEWFDSFFSNKQERTNEQNIAALRERIAVAMDSNDKSAEAELKKELGLVLLRIPLYDSAFTHFLRALQIEDSLELGSDKVISYLAMARVFEQIGEYHKGLEMLESAMEISRPMNDVDALVYILNNQGRLNTLSGLNDAAAENYQFVLQSRDSLSTRKGEAEALFNLGQLYREKRDLETALQYHKSALEIFRKMKNASAEARSLNEIGEVYEGLKNNEKALANFVVALQIRTKLDERVELAETYNNIGILYFNQKNYNRAVANLLLGLNEAKSAQSAEQTSISYDFLSLCYKDVGDFRKALEYEELSSEMVDLMRAEKIQHDLSERQNRFEIEKKELKIRELQLAQKERELKIESQRKTQNFLTILIGFGIIIILLVLYLYLVKRRANISLEAAHAKVHRQNQELQNLNATKDKFFSIISHDLKGPLNSFTAFSRMLINHTESLTKEEIQMLAKEIDKNLKNLFTLLENLLEWSRSQTGNIEFKPEPFDLNELIRQNGDLLTTQANNKKIELHYATADSYPVNVHKHSVNTVIRNLISNAIKFTPEAGRIFVSVSISEKEFKVSVRDTGVGMSEDVIKKLFRIDTKYSTQGTANEKGTGLGLILCKDFIEKNGGRIGVNSEPGKGSEFFFTLPKAAAVQISQEVTSISV
jgi:signal transduction histidine kinase